MPHVKSFPQTSFLLFGSWGPCFANSSHWSRKFSFPFLLEKTSPNQVEKERRGKCPIPKQFHPSPQVKTKTVKSHSFHSHLNVWMEIKVLLPLWVGFNRVYFTIFRAKVWKIVIFEWICCWKFKKIAKFGFGRKKSVEPSILATLLNLEIFNSKNVKNKECVHTWANSTCYTTTN